MNNIFVIKPYKRDSQYSYSCWVFDYPSVGLKAEAFVAGASEVIDRLVQKKNVKNAHRGFDLAFSSNPIPNSDAILTHVKQKELNFDSSFWKGFFHKMGFGFKRKQDLGIEFGDDYRWEAEKMDCWLCPALKKFFSSAPKKIYVKVL